MYRETNVYKILVRNLMRRQHLKDIDGKVKLSLCLTNLALCHEGVWGSGCIHPRFLDISTSWK
jgi:hypothetical protein